MMIDDEELRSIFKIASEEHLQQLEAGLLHLEQYPSDRAKLEDLLREAHSLKGDANMLGVKDVGTLAHQIEDVLGMVKRGNTALSAVSDRLYYGLDAIRKLVHESVTGEAAGVDAFHVLAHLMGAGEPKASANASTPIEHSENPELLLSHAEIDEPIDSPAASLSNDIPPAQNGHSIEPSESVVEVDAEVMAADSPLPISDLSILPTASDEEITKALSIGPNSAQVGATNGHPVTAPQEPPILDLAAPIVAATSNSM